MLLTDSNNIPDMRECTNSNVTGSVQITGNAEELRLLAGFCDEYVVHNDDSQFHAMSRDGVDMSNSRMEYEEIGHLSPTSFAVELENVYRFEAEFN